MAFLSLQIGFFHTLFSLGIGGIMAFLICPYYSLHLIDYQRYVDKKLALFRVFWSRFIYANEYTRSKPRGIKWILWFVSDQV